jgi:hypothetical protein
MYLSKANMLCVNNKFMRSYLPLVIKCSHNPDDYRKNYFKKKANEFEKLLPKTKIVYGDDLKKVLYNKWGKSICTKITNIDKNLYFEIYNDSLLTEESKNFNQICLKLEELNMIEYIMTIIEQYPRNDGPTYKKNIYINLYIKSKK